MAYSAGSSRVTSLRSAGRPRSMVAMVVDLPAPTVPASTTAPPARWQARSSVATCAGR
ncbi:Uncharacterised protein [Bordetella pertussis]|nr:Uncharacterised protein [Bordetella pertussis]